MLISYTPRFKKDIESFKSAKGCLPGKVWQLIFDIEKNPTAIAGLGNPELLRHNLKGHFSRRITREHRLVYAFDGKSETLRIISAGSHYRDLEDLI
ncbi:MAG: Txe/YoeB family addiction module toxin [Bacteroidota bacterium]